MIRFAEVNIGEGPRVHCASCGRPEEGRPLGLDEIVARLDEVFDAWPDEPGPNVSLVGMEPFAHPELPQLVAAASSRGFERIRLRTDGGALSMQGNAEGALSAGVRHIEAVVLGSPATHDACTERPGSLAAAMAGLEAFRATAAGAGVAVAVTGLVPLCVHNLEDAPSAVVALAGAGAVAVTLDASAIEPDEHSRRFVQAAAETATVNRVAVHIVGWSAADVAPYDRAPSTTVEAAS